MKYNLISIMRAGAEALDKVGDDYGRSYALHEAANNMILLLNGVDTLEDFKTCYVAGTAKELDLDARFPAPQEARPMTNPDTQQETKCPVCHGKGYLRCDCWPGDCICAFGDEDCDECGGSGVIDPDYEDYDDE